MDQNGSTNNGQDAAMLPISGMYENYFLDYASYVILERAVPLLLDGLKPVQRRILFTYNKHGFTASKPHSKVAKNSGLARYRVLA